MRFKILCAQASISGAHTVFIFPYLVEDSASRNFRLVVNLRRQSTHLKQGSSNIVKLPSSALEIEREDYPLSLDVKLVFQNFFPHPYRRDLFLFHYGGRNHNFIVLPSGRVLSVLLFTKLMRLIVRYIREWCVCIGFSAHRPLPDYHLVTRESLDRRRHHSSTLIHTETVTAADILRNPSKGCCNGSRQLENVVIPSDSEKVGVYVENKKVLPIINL